MLTMFNPAHPGEVLKEAYLDPLEMSVTEFARRIGISRKTASEFVNNVLETFVFAELLKHTATADGDYRLMYYRDTDKFEVDVVIENAAGQLVGV